MGRLLFDLARTESKLIQPKLTHEVMNLLHRLYRRLPHPPSTKYNLRHLVHNPYDMLPEGGLALDVGCKSIRGLYAFSAPKADLRLLGLDLEPFEDVDVAGMRTSYRSDQTRWMVFSMSACSNTCAIRDR